MIPAPPLPPVCYAVYRYVARRWLKVSRSWPHQWEAEQYQSELPADWQTEVKETLDAPREPRAQ